MTEFFLFTGVCEFATYSFIYFSQSTRPAAMPRSINIQQHHGVEGQKNDERNYELNAGNRVCTVVGCRGFECGRVMFSSISNDDNAKDQNMAQP